MALSGRRRWLCRRGMRELEVLLEASAERWDELFSSAAERRALDALLQRPDPELYDLLSGRAVPGDEATAVVCRKLSTYMQGSEER